MHRELVVPFELRSHQGRIDVRVVPNDDPWATGHQLVAADFDPDAFRGFPVCMAAVRYHGQAINAVMGWVQVITNGGDVSVDTVGLLPGPLYAYGYLPTFFDAPANPGHPNGEWRADTFLVAIPDVIRSHRLAPIAAFSWGYRLTAGTPELLELSRRDPADWSGRRAFLSEQCPDWQFL